MTTPIWIPQAHRLSIFNGNLLPATIGPNKTKKLLIEKGSKLKDQNFSHEDCLKVPQLQMIGLRTDLKYIVIDGEKGREVAYAGGTNGLAPSIDHLIDLKKEISIDNAYVSSAGYLTNTKVEAALSQLKDDQSNYLLNPYGASLGDSRISGRRLVVSNNVPSNLSKGTGSNLSAIIYGNFADLLIGMWGNLEILVDPYTDFAKGTTGIRALQSIDVAVRHPQSFAAMVDAIA